MHKVEDHLRLHAELSRPRTDSTEPLKPHPEPDLSHEQRKRVESIERSAGDRPLKPLV